MTLLKAPLSLEAPVADQILQKSQWHSRTLLDNYAWLKDKDYPTVDKEPILAHLRDENDYYSAVMEKQKPLTDTLFEEIKGRIKEDDESVPWFEGGFEYRWAFSAGAQYKTWYRRQRGLSEDWQVILDETKEAEGKEFFRLGTIAISPDGTKMAYSADTNGSERFTTRIVDLSTGKLLNDIIEETSGEICWQRDSQALAYVEVSKEWRPYKVYTHTLGQKTPRQIFEEADSGYFVHIGLSSDRKYLLIRSADHVTAENWTLNADDLSSDPVCLKRRQTGHDYYLDHNEDGFLIRSNKDHKNFGLYVLKEGDDWSSLLQGDDHLYIRGVKPFKDFTAVQERLDGLDQIRLIGAGGHSHVDFPEQAYEAELGHNSEYDQAFVRLTYTSMVTPPSVFDYQAASSEILLRKEQEIPTGYDKSLYVTERLMVTARDGEKIPVSLVFKKNLPASDIKPVHLYGYGAYGLGMSPAFSVARLSLLDRGFSYAIAHIRGGDEMGYAWYEAGKLEHRTNTFNDFVDVAKYLATAGYANEGEITISGGSAGGELMGAVLNQAPELFCGAVLHVPFVDVLNTMLDAELPLTPLEWPEWGNPIEDIEAFELIGSYCPYTNIEAKDYPPMMVTGGLNDPRVTYWEPAKWTAKLREMKTDDNLLLMKINMGAGHGGKSGRFERFHEVAEEYTFLLMCYGLEGNV